MSLTGLGWPSFLGMDEGWRPLTAWSRVSQALDHRVHAVAPLVQMREPLFQIDSLGRGSGPVSGASARRASPSSESAGGAAGPSTSQEPKPSPFEDVEARFKNLTVTTGVSDQQEAGGAAPNPGAQRAVTPDPDAHGAAAPSSPHREQAGEGAGEPRSPTSGAQRPTEREKRQVDEEVRQALVVQEFLESCPSQLTYHGLSSLIQDLQEGEVAVFFR